MREREREGEKERAWKEEWAGKLQLSNEYP